MPPSRPIAARSIPSSSITAAASSKTPATASCWSFQRRRRDRGCDRDATLMAERNSQLPADRAMQFRLGVHMGDVISDEDEVFGDGVNIAVRLEAMAGPGGFAVSAKAYHEAVKHLSATRRCRHPPFQEHRGRSTSGPGARGPPTPPPRTLTARHRALRQYRTAIVGVLPFANLSHATTNISPMA